jgi:Mn-containing catalase
MFFHTARLQFESKPDKPDPVYACTSCKSCSAAPTVR